MKILQQFALPRWSID